MSETLEERLSRSLNQQVGGLHDAPFGLDDVRGRARTIQRRRRGVAAGVVAAVVAIGLPVALLTGGGNDRGLDPAPAPAPPRAAFVHDGAVTLPSGTVVELPRSVADPTQLAVLSDGRTVATAGRSVVVLAADGTVEIEERVRLNVITVDGDRLVAWRDPDGKVRVLEAGVAEPVTFPGIPVPDEAEASVDAILGADCASGGCQVLGGEWTVTDEAVGLDGPSDLVTPEPLRVIDVSPDQATWAVQYADPADEQYGCVGLYDPGSATITARSCETAWLRFSPDGERLFGLKGDNQQAGQIEVLDLDLQISRVFEPAGQLISTATWDTPDTLLVALADRRGTSWTVERVDVTTGERQVVAGPTPGTEFAPAYRVAQ